MQANWTLQLENLILSNLKIEKAVFPALIRILNIAAFSLCLCLHSLKLQSIMQWHALLVQHVPRSYAAHLMRLLTASRLTLNVWKLQNTMSDHNWLNNWGKWPNFWPWYLASLSVMRISPQSPPHRIKLLPRLFLLKILPKRSAASVYLVAVQKIVFNLFLSCLANEHDFSFLPFFGWF